MFFKSGCLKSVPNYQPKINCLLETKTKNIEYRYEIRKKILFDKFHLNREEKNIFNIKYV